MRDHIEQTVEDVDFDGRPQHLSSGPQMKHMDFTTTEEDQMFFDGLQDFIEIDDSYDFEIKEQESYDSHVREIQKIGGAANTELGNK